LAFVFKIARTDDEFEKIHELNYKTFVEEIPQHQENETKKRVDSFHHENIYLICLKDGQLIGMLAIRNNRPFSLDNKLGNFENYLPISASKPCEIRLLAVEKEFRQGKVFFGLAQLLARYCLKEGYDIAVISGTTREEKLYNQLGFQPFASKIGTAEALYQPMYLTKETFDESLAGRLLVETVNFLPGPLLIEENVKDSFTTSPISHRSERFTNQMKRVRDMLCDMTKAKDVQVLLGTGTLANDVIAGQLSLLRGKGLIVVNGEFGTRLVDHANRAGLHFSVIEKQWGELITNKEIEDKLQSESYSWIWTVHCETSTGMLHDINVLSELCFNMNVKLCLDCISSIGTVPLNLENVYLASGVSGKAIGSYTGLSFVFHNYRPQPSNRLPRYLDLGMYAINDSIAYSQSSNLLSALEQALLKLNSYDHYAEIQDKHKKIRQKVDELGLSFVTKEMYSSPGIITIKLPNHISSKDFGDDLFLQGFHLHYDSAYLRKRNWIQISTMSNQSEKELSKMLSSFEDLLNTYRISSKI
jgi:aspartate aminotransferase-like enzyme